MNMIKTSGSGTRMNDRLLARRLAEANRRKDEFLAMLAHELRSPLAAIGSACEILHQFDGTNPHLHQARGVIDRQVAHLTRLVEDVLDVARLKRGKVQLHKERVELASVVACAVEASHSLVNSPRQELTVSLPSAPLWLKADPVRLVQILVNLLNNAAKYTDQGGHIWLIATRVGSEAVVQVRDTGIGIPAEMLSGIFELFSQVDGRLNGSQGGLGIGLALVRSLVEMHGGSVQAFSSGLGQGSEFVIRLPLLLNADQNCDLPEKRNDGIGPNASDGQRLEEHASSRSAEAGAAHPHC